MKPLSLFILIILTISINSCENQTKTKQVEQEAMFKPMELTIDNKLLEVNKTDIKLNATSNPYCVIKPITKFAIRFDEFVNSVLITMDRINKLDSLPFKIGDIKIATSTTQSKSINFGAKLFGDVIEVASEDSKENDKTQTFSISQPNGNINVSIKSKSFLDSLNNEHTKIMDDYRAAKTVLNELYDSHKSTEDGIVEKRQAQRDIVSNLDCLEKQTRILYNIYSAKARFENQLFKECIAAIKNYNYLATVTPSIAGCFTVDFAVTFTTDNKFGFAFNIFGGAEFKSSSANAVQLIFGNKELCL